MLRLDKLLVVVLDEKSTGPERAARLLKTWALARVLGLDEHLPPAEQEALEAAAILREIGAALSEELYGDTLPEHQAEFAPGAAQSLLERLDAGEETARRVAALLSRPRQPEAAGAEGLLAEAELLTALLEGALAPPEREEAARRLQSEAGRRWFREWSREERKAWS